MADCGDFSHQAIDYQGLFDLKDAQIIRAEIDVIDVANNEAAVTLLDACDFDDWLDTDAVPFFYHCEFSSGTIEDLAKGHKAFMVGDMVYIILLPGKGEAVPPQAYIVGHVDIRGTKECLPREYLYLRFYVEIDSVESIIVTVFDVTAGTVLDLVSFEPIDGSSPAAPASFPCIQTTAVIDWIDYNFNGATAQVLVPCNVSRTGPGINEWEPNYAPEITDEFTDYTGTGVRPCNEVSVGNGLYHSLDVYDGLVPLITAYDAYGYQKSQRDFSGAEIFPVGSSCGVYAPSLIIHRKTIQDYGPGFFGISVAATIGFSFAPFIIPILRRDEWDYDITMTCDGEVSESATLNFTQSFENKYTIDFSGIGGEIFEHSLSSNCSSVFDLSPAPGSGAQVDNLSPSSGTCDKPNWDIPNNVIGSLSYDFLTHLFSPWIRMETESQSIKSGEVGVYVFWGAIGLQEWFVTEGINPFKATIYYDKVWGGNAKVYINETSDRELRAVFQPFCTVTLLEGNFTVTPPDVDILISEVFEKANVQKSNGLNSAVVEVAEFAKIELIDPIATLVDRNAATLELFTGLQQGPLVDILKKKPLP